MVLNTSKGPETKRTFGQKLMFALKSLAVVAIIFGVTAETDTILAADFGTDIK